MTHEQQCRKAAEELRDKGFLCPGMTPERITRNIAAIIARCTRPEGLIGACEDIANWLQAADSLDSQPTKKTTARCLKRARTALADYPEPEEEPHEPA